MKSCFINYIIIVHVVLLMNGCEVKCQIGAIFTVVGGAVSSLAKITFGVPQG